ACVTLVCQGQSFRRHHGHPLPLVKKLFLLNWGPGDYRSGGRAMRYKLRLFVSIFLLSSLDGVIVCVAQQDQVEPMEKTPVFRANVVTRTTKAVDDRHRGGSTKVDLWLTDLMPQASGSAKVERK